MGALYGDVAAPPLKSWSAELTLRSLQCLKAGSREP